MGTDRTLWKTQQFCDRPMGPAFQIVEQDDFAPILRQRVKGREEPPPEVGLLGARIRRGALVGRLGFVEPHMSRILAVAAMILRPVSRDLPEPRPEERRGPALVDPREGVHHCILADIFRASRITDDRQGHGPAAAEVLLRQLPGGLPVSGSHLLDEFRIGFVHWPTR